MGEGIIVTKTYGTAGVSIVSISEQSFPWEEKSKDQCV